MLYKIFLTQSYWKLTDLTKTSHENLLKNNKIQLNYLQKIFEWCGYFFKIIN